MSETELAWAAGFFDGEGNISRDHRTGNLVLQIPQIYTEPLVRFLKAVNCGTIGGPYKQKDRAGYHCQDQFKFRVTRIDDIRKTVKLLRPYLTSIKLTQADAMLRSAESKVGRPVNFWLTREQVLEIRKQYNNGEKIMALAKQYNKDSSTIRRAVKGITWGIV